MKKDVKEMDLAELVAFFKDNPDWKGVDQITVMVEGVQYCGPWYCLTELLWGMPDSFYPCDKYEWADHPLFFTSIEMLKEAISIDKNKFVAFIKK